MKKIKQFNFIESVKSYFKLQPFMEIMPWIEKNISLADDVSSERDKPDFTQYPYQVEILKQWQDLNIRKHVIVVSCEQLRLKRRCFFMDFYIEWYLTLANFLFVTHQMERQLKRI